MPDTHTTCEQLREELKALRERLTQAIQEHQPISTKTAHAYNATLFHLQSAREELRRTFRSISQKD